MEQPYFIHVTDGAPRNGHDATRLGFSTPVEYARARRHELLEALSLAGIPPVHSLAIGIPDQETALQLEKVVQILTALFDQIKPDLVLSHAYEGGHPDHDATAFAVHAARQMAALSPDLWEFTCYHNHSGSLAVNEFLAGQNGVPALSEVELQLTEDARELKRRMLSCFVSQRAMLSQFPLHDVERFRRAPEYDFKLPPHAGQLYYELFDWGMKGDRWRALAQEALQTLEINRPI
jgi:LmbE family N-acetylglucosaminyl deacetylase